LEVKRVVKMIEDCKKELAYLSHFQSKWNNIYGANNSNIIWYICTHNHQNRMFYIEV
jgi:hypothetical protein